MKLRGSQQELFSENTLGFLDRNKEQQLAVEAPVNRHMRIIAGPGAGKTRVLVNRLAHLIDLGNPPARMAIITYTNSARDELIDRIDRQLGRAAHGLFVGTIHQLCLQLSLDVRGKLGLPEKIRVLEQAEARRMFAARVDTQGWGDAKRLFDEMSLERQRWDGGGDAPWADSYTDKVWNKFDEVMKRFGLASFTSLQLWAIDAMDCESTPPLEFVFVDEYQDTSGLQVRLLHSLAKLGTFITVVGDPEQSIFRFAGAEPLQLDNFPNRFSPCSSYTLEANGRSTESIVRLAGALRTQSDQFALRPRGPRPVLWYLNSESQQAKMVSQEIRKLMDDGFTRAEHVAILSREGEQLPMAAALEDMGIAYWQSRSVRFEERPHVRQLIILVDALCFSQDEGAQFFLFEHVIKGAPKTWGLLLDELTKTGGFDDAISSAEKTVARPRRAALTQFKTVRRALAQLAHLEPAKIVAQIFLQIMEPMFGLRELKMADEIRDDIQRIAIAAQGYSTPQNLSAWLRQGGLAPQPKTDCVTLGTLHFAKGREWDVVFLVDLTHGVIPHRLNPDMQEERRLLHVGVSRARDLLYLSSPQRLPGRGDGHSPLLDRFTDLCQVADLRS